MAGDPVPISLGIRSNPARNPQAGRATLTNCAAEETGEDSKTPWTIYGTPGLVPFGAPLVGGGIRAAIEISGVLYVVAGRNIYTVSAGGTATLIGGIPTDGAVKMVRNRRIPAQIGVVSSGVYIIIDTGANSVTQISDPDLPSPISIDFLDGYFILPISNGRFMITGIDDGASIDGLDIGACDAYPDEIVQVAVLERQIYFFGTQSFEVHQDTGAADFPIERVHATETGCLSGLSVAKIDTETEKTLIWVAPDHTVRMINGYGSQVISTNEIEQLIKDLHVAGRIAELKGISWADSGRFYYALSCEDWTRCWNSKSGGKWHNLASYGLKRWRISAACQFGTKMIVGDYANGQLYELTHAAFDEAGSPLVMEIITPPVHASPFPLQLNALYLSAAKGVGLNSTQDYIADPVIMVSLSKDGGNTWSPERIRKMGKLGSTAKRIPPIRRLGQCGENGFMLRLRISAPVERMLLGASIDFDKLSV